MCKKRFSMKKAIKKWLCEHGIHWFVRVNSIESYCEWCGLERVDDYDDFSNMKMS